MCSCKMLNARQDWLPKSILVTADRLNLVLQVMRMLQMAVKLVLYKCQWCIQGSCNNTADGLNVQPTLSVPTELLIRWTAN